MKSLSSGLYRSHVNGMYAVHGWMVCVWACMRACVCVDFGGTIAVGTSVVFYIWIRSG